jgi:hypothetical protein
MIVITLALFVTAPALDLTEKWRIDKDHMDINGYCGIVGNNEHYPNHTYAVDIFENPANVAVVVLVQDLNHTSVGRISFHMSPSSNNQRRSCHSYLLAAEKTLGQLNLQLMQIPRINIRGLQSIPITGPGGFQVTEYTVSSSINLWHTSSWAQLHCPHGDGYTIFSDTPMSSILHPKGVCGSVSFVREQFKANCV